MLKKISYLCVLNSIYLDKIVSFNTLDKTKSQANFTCYM